MPQFYQNLENASKTTRTISHISSCDNLKRMIAKKKVIAKLKWILTKVIFFLGKGYLRITRAIHR